ncbi:BTAD domain-containing putative transcriptional regulator [Streptomyces sp. CC219B]|uniref:AfsR/SARP family transcriptional regulator n=1 Tax=Streptomyces sp. CC219B TaxID=3044574 RepID=UPI0024A908D3|nr:BTAD domain-containing putative transcriptional regulator [Streptomyces sp. CC219B]
MCAHPVRFQLLGPLKAEIDGQSVVLTGRQRALCSVLLLHTNHVVSVQRIVELLWEDRPPQAGAARVRALVAEVRRALGQAGSALLETCKPGYVMRAARSDLDVARFEDLIREGTAAQARGGWRMARDAYSHALDLWRGEPLPDLTVPVAEAERQRLGELRMVAFEGAAAAQLELGDLGEAIAGLRWFTSEHPLREHPHALLMRALHQDGRTAEALEVYAALRRRMIDELGMEPSDELAALHHHLLGGNGGRPGERQATRPASPRIEPVPGRLVPRQLRVPPRHFVGRSAEMRQFDGYRQAGEPLVLLTGPAGVGKTALALNWAARAANHFPDGQLFLDMRGFDDGEPMTPKEALPILLQGLGRRPQDIPLGVETQTALYRTLLADRKVLVVLDDVADASYVPPLLPASSDSMTIVTSRHKLGSLMLEGACRVVCDLLDSTAALRLLGSGSAAAAVTAEPEAARRLVDLCDGLPLALCIARSWLSGDHPDGIQGYVDELTDRGRLARLHADGDESVAVRAALDLSYRTLPSDARRAFRALGLVSGTGRSAAAAAAAAGTDTERAVELLRCAEGVHLLQDGGGRWTWHDLVHDYADARAQAEDDEPARQASVERLLAHYLHSVVAAAKACSFYLPRMDLPEVEGAAPRSFRTRQQATVWFDTEWSDIVAAITHAAEHGPVPYAWRLVDALQDFLHHWCPLSEWTRLAELTRQAARRSGDETGDAAVSLSLGHAHWRGGNLQAALDAYEDAGTAARRAGWLHGQATSLQGKGVTLKILGEAKKALPCYQQAVSLYRSLGDVSTESIMLTNLASLDLSLGRLIEAEKEATEAIELVRSDQHHHRARALVYLALVRQHQGRLSEAMTTLRESLLLCRDSDFLFAEALALEALGHVHFDAGRDEQAWLAYTDALTVARCAENPNGQADCLTGLAMLALRAGRPDDAGRCLSSAENLINRTGHRAGEIEVLFTRAALSAVGGDPAAALKSLELASRLAEGAGVLSLPRIYSAIAAARLDLGEPANAVCRAEQAVTAARNIGQQLAWARASQGLAAAHQAVGNHEAAEAAERQSHALFTRAGTPASHRTALPWQVRDGVLRPTTILRGRPWDQDERILPTNLAPLRDRYLADHFPEAPR